MTDARTTPRRLRVPGLIALGVLAAYFVFCYVGALNSRPPELVRRFPYAAWFGGWSMFTTLERYHTVLEAKAAVDGEWVDVDLDALFPFRWESGNRYARSAFRQNRTRMRTLGQATCMRLESQEGLKADAVRFTQVRWRKTRGQLEQPRGEGSRESQESLLLWDCKVRLPLPDGVRI